MANILVANDDRDLLESCQDILEQDGHVVQVAPGGAGALMPARTWRPDLILIDWVMPDMNGPTAIAALRADAATERLPIVLMSGTDGGERVALEIGADRFLRKPFQPAKLLACIRNLLQEAERRIETGPSG